MRTLLAVLLLSLLAGCGGGGDQPCDAPKVVNANGVCVEPGDHSDDPR